ncbi:MAG TPA: sigma-E factor negative regulatory protein [Gammaproteobacteria bacterium]|jgi:sigma-E factor negative regulatory protein RseA|nr:sigma-E factor negative regulatory protein [Gammaproteobacteria bacterium]
MTEQINDQISAFIDDELSAEESALLVRRFERDPNARAQALRYTLIGAALRGELIEPRPSVLQRRIAVSLDGAAPAVEKRAAHWSARYARPLLGVGIAAAVAVAAIGTLRLVNEAGVAPGAPVAGPVQARDQVVAPSYVVPQDATPAGPVTSPIRLTNYLIHHSEYASGLGRASVSSNVVGASVEPVPDSSAEAEAQWR